MASLTVENFLGGVDRSRPRYVLPAGTLWSGINGHITRGGDFEKRKAFVPKYGLPEGTFGLAKTASSLVVFGSQSTPSGMPTGVSYQQLVHPTSSNTPLSRLRSHDLYDGKIYAVADYDDGTRHHYYDAANVADWEQQTTNFPIGGVGSLIRTHNRKLYSPVGSVLWFSGVDTAIGWEYAGGSLDPGAGFQNLSTHQSGSDEIMGLITYQNLLAAFSRRVIQTWDMQDDEDQNAPVQTIYESGLRAPKALIGFGDIDAFYLADDGIRSLRARNLTNIAGVNDVGTPIDDLVIEWMASLSEAEIQAAVAAIEPLDGRFWLAIGSRIFVFSYFPTKKVSSWTWYEPGVTFTDIVSFNGRLYARAGNTIYLYGGDDNNTYDASVATLELPFLTASKPGSAKDFEGIDISAMGEWDVKVRVNPRDETQVVNVGRLEGVTFPEEGVGSAARSHYLAPVMTSRGSSRATVSQISLWYDDGEAKH